MGATNRLDRLVAELLDAPDPVRAIAGLVADHEARMDALARRLHALEAAVKDRPGEDR